MLFRKNILTQSNIYFFFLLFYCFIADHVRLKNEPGLWRTLLCCFGKSRTRPNSSFVPSSNTRGVNTKSDRSFTPPRSPDLSQSSYLLPAIRHQDMHKKCMVIDLDETLVHSSFKVHRKCIIYLYLTH